MRYERGINMLLDYINDIEKERRREIEKRREIRRRSDEECQRIRQESKRQLAEIEEKHAEEMKKIEDRNKRYREAFNKIAPHIPKKGERLNDRGKTLLEEMERFTKESNELLMQLAEEIKAGS